MGCAGVAIQKSTTSTSSVAVQRRRVACTVRAPSVLATVVLAVSSTRPVGVASSVPRSASTTPLVPGEVRCTGDAADAVAHPRPDEPGERAEDGMRVGHVASLRA